jgi:hypothetical protein
MFNTIFSCYLPAGIGIWNSTRWTLYFVGNRTSSEERICCCCWLLSPPFLSFWSNLKRTRRVGDDTSVGLKIEKSLEDVIFRLDWDDDDPICPYWI